VTIATYGVRPLTSVPSVEQLPTLWKAKNWIVCLGLPLAGTLFVLWAAGEEGWAQAWRIEVGAAIGLLGPFYFVEELLRSRVASLEERVGELRTSYGLVRSLLPAGDTRMHVLDVLLAAVTKQARASTYPRKQIASLLQGDHETRTIAFAAMRGDHRLIDDAAVVRAIDSSESGMEQFYAALDEWLRPGPPSTMS
jgi:hypothetical protein